MVGFFKAEELAAAGCPISAATRYPWPCSLVLPNWTGKASTIKHLLMHVFLANAAPVALSRAKIYLAPGKPTRNYGNLDAASAGKLRLLVAELAADGARSTVKALLTHIGILGAYSHNRQFFPKTAALIDEFKRSEQSTRKLGGRPRQRAHMS
jgi:hypothetical protein